MVKLGIIQTGTYKDNSEGITKISKILSSLGKSGTDIVCLPEQWLKNNRISDYTVEFEKFIGIAEKFSMTIIPGAFYEKTSAGWTISAPIIGPSGKIIGKQEKIHPFDYERNLIKPGKEAKIFETSCKFGIGICYDMIFPKFSESLVKKGAQVLFSPSRIVKRGTIPWEMYIQVRSLENRVPILAANVQNYRFGGNSLIVDLMENNKVVLPKITKIVEVRGVSKNFNLKKYSKSRKRRYLDSRKFR